jgi:hypothetical protein
VIKGNERSIDLKKHLSIDSIDFGYCWMWRIGLLPSTPLERSPVLCAVFYYKRTCLWLDRRTEVFVVLHVSPVATHKGILNPTLNHFNEYLIRTARPSMILNVPKISSFTLLRCLYTHVGNKILPKKVGTEKISYGFKWDFYLLHVICLFPGRHHLFPRIGVFHLEHGTGSRHWTSFPTCIFHLVLLDICPPRPCSQRSRKSIILCQKHIQYAYAGWKWGTGLEKPAFNRGKLSPSMSRALGNFFLPFFSWKFSRR